MSQYALFLAKNNQGKKSFCVFKNTAHNGIELGRLFGINTNNTHFVFFFNLLYYICMTVYWYKLKHLVLSVLKYFYITPFLEENKYYFHQNVLNDSAGLNLYIGGWHHHKYFSEIEDLIRKTYVFPNFRDRRNRKLRIQSQDQRAVAIHIRRGDYMDQVNYEMYGKVCDAEYYIKAMTQVEEEILNPIYYIFSNDMEWSRGLMRGRKAIYVDWNKGNNSWADMALMSEFKNIIIANSTFSWWAAYLGDTEKYVLCPSYFVYGDKSSDIFLPAWKRVS